MTGKIFLLEGADYTGKTSVAKYLATKLDDAVYYHSPSGKNHITENLYQVLKGEDSLLTADVRTLLFLTTNIINISEINRLKSEGKTVIVDRSILSMLVYQDINLDKYMKLTHLFHVPMLNVDHVFLFCAAENAIMQRYMTRQTRDNMDEFFIKRITAIGEKYKKYTPLLYPIEHTTMVDTTSKDMMETCQWAEMYMHKLLQTSPSKNQNR